MDRDRLAAGAATRVIFSPELTADLLPQLQAALGAGYRFDRELGGEIAHDLRGYLLRAGQAYHLLARGDSAAALRQFTTLPDSACFSLCATDELVRAQLLDSRGRSAEALRLLERHIDGGWLPILPSEIERSLVRGRLQEKLGMKDEAAASYNTVIDAWQHADSGLQGFVREARAGLSRMGAERPAGRRGGP